MSNTYELNSRVTTGDGEKKTSQLYKRQSGYANDAFTTPDHGNHVKAEEPERRSDAQSSVITDDADTMENILTDNEIEKGKIRNGNAKDATSQDGSSGLSNQVQEELSKLWTNYGDAVVAVVACAFIAFYASYLGYAMWYEFGSESSVRLLWMSLLGVFIVLVSMVQDRFGKRIYSAVFEPISRFVSERYTFFKIFLLIAVLAGLLVFMIVEVALKIPYNLVSFSGYIVFVILFFAFSYNPSKVRWRPVIWGLGIQFCFALIVLRTLWGYKTFKWIGDRVQEYMEYTDAGSEFVFGPDFEDHFFAFKVLPVVLFFSATISVLYYVGVMQAIISKLAWIMSRTMGTTAAESTNAAGNIFIGQTEAPLLIRPLINNMSNSEIHAVMVGGFATIAGSVMATYIVFGVPANHLVTASVMAAPAALAMSKLSYPEEDLEKLKNAGNAEMEVPPYSNLIEAAAAGASAAVPLVANIAANLIVFIAAIEFLNTTLTWMGHRVGLWAPEYQELTFQMICSYLLWPFAFLMGVPREDCRKVAELVGVKIFVNEFVAFTELGKLIDNTEVFNDYTGEWEATNNGDIYLIDTNQTLVGGVMQDRSIVISTYALCGFANVASIGTVMGALGTMAPDKQSDISSMAVRAMITGTVVSFMNACIAGLMYEGES